LLLASSLLDADACESGCIGPQSGYNDPQVAAHATAATELQQLQQSYNDPQVAGNDAQVAGRGGGGTCEAKRAGRVDRTGSLGLELQVHKCTRP
jgi:hypothetical protein